MINVKKKLQKILILFFAGLTIMAPNSSFAQDKKKGDVELEVVSGYSHTPILPDKDQEDWNYILSSVRAGLTLKDVKNKFIPDGNIEGLIGLTYSQVTNGWGNYMIGIDTLLRYNVNTGTKFTPYIHFGCGILYNDIFKDMSQGVIGNNIEFSPQAGIGGKYAVNNYFSIGFELLYHHVSNAGLGKWPDGSTRNEGSDGLIGLINISIKLND